MSVTKSFDNFHDEVTETYDYIIEQMQEDKQPERHELFKKASKMSVLLGEFMKEIKQMPTA